MSASSIEPHAAGRAATRLTARQLSQLQRICERFRDLAEKVTHIETVEAAAASCPAFVREEQEFHRIILCRRRQPARHEPDLDAPPPGRRSGPTSTRAIQRQVMIAGEHESILQALEARRAELAAQRMLLHICGSRRPPAEARRRPAGTREKLNRHDAQTVRSPRGRRGPFRTQRGSAWRCHVSSLPRIHADRAPGGHRDHRRPGRDPASRGSSRRREAARQTQCKNNLKQIGVAMDSYHETFDVFPCVDSPASTTSTGGRGPAGAMVPPDPPLHRPAERPPAARPNDDRRNPRRRRASEIYRAPQDLRRLWVASFMCLRSELGSIIAPATPTASGRELTSRRSGSTTLGTYGAAKPRSDRRTACSTSSRRPASATSSTERATP